MTEAAIESSETPERRGWADDWPIEGTDVFIAVFNADGGVGLSGKDKAALAEAADWLRGTEQFEPLSELLERIQDPKRRAGIRRGETRPLREFFLDVGRQELAKVAPESVL